MVLNKGADLKSIENAEKEMNFVFPEDFKEFLLFSNGATGDIDGDYLELWAVEEIPASNRVIEMDKYSPGLIAFGGDGANELYAFDARKTPCAIVQIPMIGMDLDSVWKCADTFEHFLISKSSSRIN